MESIIVIDNFLQNPDEVRRMALSQTYKKNDASGGYWPGGRTEQVSKLNPEYADPIHRKVLSVAYNIERSSDMAVKISSEFQYVTDDFGFGKVHRDPDEVAAVLYLTPDAPVDSGTEFYKQVANIPEDLSAAYTDVCASVATGNPITEEQQKIKDAFFSNYVKTDVVANIYNRLVVYPSIYPHCATRYFGNTLKDARLTQVFFITCDYHNARFKYKSDSLRYGNDFKPDFM
jgi:hypothetical protein